MSKDTSTPETGEAMTAEDFASSLINPEPSKGAPPEEADEEATQDEAEAEQAAADESAAEEADPEDPEAEEAEEQPELYTVRVDGVDEQVTFDELLKGYSREGDYQRKTQRLAAERQQVRGEIEQMREAWKAKMAELAQPSEAEPDWLALSRDDPLGWPEKRAEWEAKERKRQEAAQNLYRAQVEDYQRRLSEGREQLLRDVPEWQDAERYQKDTAEIRRHANEAYGLSDEEMSRVLDPRHVRVLRDAVAYRKLQAANPVVQKKVASAPKSIRPGAAQSKAGKKAEASRALADRVRKTGSTDAFVDWLTAGDD